MQEFTPIAVVGQGCVLPGALEPAQLWEIVESGEDVLGTVPDDYWGVEPGDVATDADDPEPDKTWTDRGGFVRGFDEAFDPSGFRRPAGEIERLDPVFQWGLYAGRQALAEAGIDVGERREDAGIILGNKSYPTHSFSDFAEDVWRRENGWDSVHDVDPLNRFMSGLPAQLVADALGLKGGSYCLDVACASSLYAIKLACDRLQRGDADLMLAGGINRADDLFLRIGFCALQAMSRTGQSRPFHREADGLVPAEGAAFVALKRLDDALEDGDDVLGVIRGVGLSNDGRSRGLLTPSEEGQVRCMRQAYERAGLDPKTISLVECHAAGTPLGDATEVRSVSRIFEDLDEQLPIASLKSNLGHLITVSGVAGLLKIIGAMEHEVRPATLNADDPIEELDGGPVRHLTEPEPWEADGPRRAAINNFGFGGNNAHLIVEEFQPETGAIPVDVELTRPDPEEIAIVDISVIAADGRDRDDFARSLLYGESRVGDGDDGPEGRADEIELDVGEVRFPPLDLKQALPQQLRILEATLQLSETIDELPRDETGIMLGMQCDAEICRYLVRWRLGQQLVDGDEDHRSGLIEALEAAGVLGSMPNLVTNRLNSQFDLAGASLTLSGEELSGMLALRLAGEALRKGELDAAVIGAVDMSCEPVHRAAAEAVLNEDRHIPGDAAVAMVLKRADDARRDGDTIHAVVPAPEVRDGEGFQPQQVIDESQVTELFGHSHAASGLLNVAAAAEACSRRAQPAREDEPPMPWLPDRGARRTTVEMQTVTGERMTSAVQADPGASPNPLVEGEPPQLAVYAADDVASLRRRVADRTPGDDGSLRVAIAARGARQSEKRHQLAVDALGEVESPQPFAKLGRGVYLGAGEIEGETSFVFTGPAGSYQGMGRELVLALPELADGFAARCHAVDRAAGWIYDEPTDENPGPGKKLWGASFLCQVHAQLTRDILGVDPEAAIGFCAGETNALFAMGAWNDFDGLYEDLEREGIFDRRLGGQFTTVERAWDTEEADWQTWRLLAPIDVVEPIVEQQERCYITIVNAPGDLVVGGAPEACGRVIEEIGKKRARPLGYNIAMHCPATEPIEKLWHDMHHRRTEPVEGVRFYTHSTLDSYEVNADRIADALVGQAMNRVNFPKLVNKAYDDGVRVFIEHGPRSGCTRWIRKILGDRPHLAVSLDRTGKSSLDRVVDTTARLFAAGVDVDHRALVKRLERAEPLEAHDERTQSSQGTTLTFDAHLPPVRLPGGDGDTADAADRRPEPRDATGEPTGEKPAGDSIDLSADPRPQEGAARLPLAPVLPSVSAPLPETRRPAASANGTDGAVVEGPDCEPPQPGSESESSPQQTPAPAGGPPAVRSAQPCETCPPAKREPDTAPGRLAQLHNEFLEQRAGLHREFLERQRQRAAWFVEMHEQGAAPPAVTELTEPGSTEMTKIGSPPPHAGDPADRDEPAGTIQTDHRGEPDGTAAGGPAANGRQRTGRAGRVEQEQTRPDTVVFDREELKVHAAGRIAEIFGPMFEQQDDYPRQVRMPTPPLLLADRVTGIDAEPGAMENTGVIWTETDVAAHAEHLHRGRMPVGLTVESGQADLMLISWMGADFDNRGERVYRLLGCELTFHGELPKPGETLEFEIHIDAHARQGAVHIFFFHYDCLVDGEPRLTMREGQAGFFTDEELANSEGVLWTPEDIDTSVDADEPFEPPVLPKRTEFGAEQLEAFSAGYAFECFGEGFERLAAHTETPKIQGGKMQFLDRVDTFDPGGGPTERGYLRAVQELSADDWFFDGHFKNDPCMPGTLMLQACTQAMAFHMTALGLTIGRDGWRFEPVPDQSCSMRCRGQVTPESDQIVYELYVREVTDGPEPTMYADLLCTVDGLKAFHCERLGLRLVPDWPLQRHREWIDDEIAKNVDEQRPVATADGFAYDQAAIMACCLGRPSAAFGPMYRRFDGPTKVPRLPNPPYLFVSRIADIDGEPGGMQSGSTVVAEYDVPPDAWYFEDDNTGSMPFAALMEVGLQPCGWLASFVGCVLDADQELFFRNLDGTGEVFGEVTPDTGVLTTETTLTNISRSGPMTIVNFEVEVGADGKKVFAMDTVFGFFPDEALAQQDGLATTDEQRVGLEESADATIRADIPGLNDRLQMFDRVTGWWPEGGEAGLGRIRTEQDVDPSAWYFKSHFFQDPVQPGSLGVEGMVQLLKLVMLEQGMHRGVDNPRFVPVATGQETTWKYRGQVVPENDTVQLDMEITERSEPGADRPRAVATASLWVDGTRIYEVNGLGMEIVEGDEETAITEQPVVATRQLDPAVDTWLKDHRPTFTRPALPMTCIADYIARAAGGREEGRVVELSDVHLMGWAVVDGPTELTARVASAGGETGSYEVGLLTTEKDVAVGRVKLADDWPDPPQSVEPLENTEPMGDPYASGEMFHGPAFQLLESGEEGESGSTAVLDAGAGDVPVGRLHPALLDAALHVIPHDDLGRWSDAITEESVAYPHRIERLTVHGPTPTEGEIRVETRLVGFADDDNRLPVFRIQFVDDGRVWAEMQLVELLFPKGRIARGEPGARRRFLRDGEYVEGLGVSQFDGDTTRLSVKQFRNNDWFEGTIATVYGVDQSLDIVEQTRRVAVKDHLARRLKVHPSDIDVDDDVARCDEYPGEVFEVQVDSPAPMEFVVN